jgi:mono/diheme cytochrome c family protein
MRTPASRSAYRRVRAIAPVALCLAAGVLVSIATSAASGMGSTSKSGGSSPTVITVDAGSPSALAFTLSKTVDLPPGILTFKVTSMGKVRHSFKLCTLPVTNTKHDTCTGVETKTLKPGQSSTLTVTLIEPGRYEYLSTVAGQAARGMKGLITVGVNAAGVAPPPPDVASGTTTTCSGRCAPATTTTPTTKPPALESLAGDPTVGATLFPSNCGSCHALAAANTTGTAGPNLDAYAPTQEILVSYITYGSDSMPAFGGTLTGPQINALAAYVYRSTHA